MATVLLGNAPGGKMRSSIFQQLFCGRWYSDICDRQRLFHKYNQQKSLKLCLYNVVFLFYRPISLAEYMSVFNKIIWRKEYQIKSRSWNNKIILIRRNIVFKTDLGCWPVASWFYFFFLFPSFAIITIGSLMLKCMNPPICQGNPARSGFPLAVCRSTIRLNVICNSIIVKGEHCRTLTP